MRTHQENSDDKKVSILTQHLLNNYGGLLQNYALQHILKKMGCNVTTIDYLRTITFIPFWRYLLSCLKTIFLFLFLGKRREFIRFSHKGRRSALTETFVSNCIETSFKCYRYKRNMLQKKDVVIVGSDQVWRPKYNYRIEDMYLKFAENLPIKRIAYAASFGVNAWEYSPKQTLECSKLAKKFDAISVREESGVKLCKEHLGVDATWVLDPTLLLTKEDYLPICEDVAVCNEKYIAVYVLDENEDVTATYEKEAAARGLVVKKFHADSKSTLTVPEWLAMFRDASYVVTDSFHGTVFSIIFGKEFKCIYNKGRGAARFESLMNLYNSGKLEEMREFSINWLRKALEK